MYGEQFESSPGGTIEPIDNVTLTIGEQNADVDIQGRHADKILVLVNDTEGYK